MTSPRKSKFIRGLIGTLIGGLAGAAVSGVVFGLDASLELGSSILGPARNFWPLNAIVGSLAGAVFGFVLGLCIALSNPRLHTGLLVGFTVGLFGSLVMTSFDSSADWQLRSTAAQFGPSLLLLVGWGMIGLLLSAVAHKSSERF